jgi:hypothetical protein
VPTNIGRAKVKNPKKRGKEGEAVISKFGSAIAALRYRYQPHFPDFVMFLHFNAMGKNFVFQRIQSFPLDKIQCVSSTNSVAFSAKWESGGALPFLIPKKLLDIKIKESGSELEWNEVATLPPIDKFGNGVVRSGRWVEVHNADKIDAEMDIKIDGIKSINMYNWGFELIGDVISLLAINKNIEFPEFPMSIKLDIPKLSFDAGRLFGKEEFFVRWSEPGYERVKDGISEFDKMLFDEEIKKEEEPEIIVKDFGQRCLNNLIIED